MEYKSAINEEFYEFDLKMERMNSKIETTKVD